MKTFLKKTLAILLALMLVFSVAACGSDDADKGRSKPATSSKANEDKADNMISGDFNSDEETEKTESDSSSSSHQDEEEDNGYEEEKTNTTKPNKNNKEYIIGFSGPLSGPAAVYGEAVRNAAQMAVDEINAAGGLDGVKFKLEAMDDKHDATNVAANFTALMEGGMQVSLGTVTTAPGLEFTELSKDKVFFLTPTASGDGIPKYSNGFQMTFADGNQGKAAAEYVNTLGKGKIGIFYQADDIYSVKICQQFKQYIDPSISTVETVFTNNNASDFTAQVDTLKDCDFIFMPIYYQPASVFIMQAKGVIADNATYYGCDGFEGLAEQIDLATIPQKISMLSQFNPKDADKATKNFVRNYTTKYGTYTLNQFGASAYDSVYAIYYAMKELKDSGKNINVQISAESLCKLLSKHFTNGFTFSGVTANKATWDKNGYVQKTAKVYVLKEAD